MLKGKKTRISVASIALILISGITAFADGAAEARASGHIGGPVLTILPLLIILFLAVLALAYIPANIARKKGYGFIGFYILGIFFFFVALIVSLCLSDKKQQIAEIKQAFNSEKVTSSIADELKKYSELLEQGAISQEEFNAIKRKLM